MTPFKTMSSYVRIHNEKSNYYCIRVIDLVFLFVWKQTVIFTVVLLTEILVLWAVLCIFRLLIDSAAFAFVHLYPLTERHGGLYLCQQLRRKILQHWRVYSTCAQRDLRSTCITYSTHRVWNTLLYIIFKLSLSANLDNLILNNGRIHRAISLLQVTITLCKW